MKADDLSIIQECISEFSTRDQSVPWVTDAQAALERLTVERDEFWHRFNLYPMQKVRAWEKFLEMNPDLAERFEQFQIGFGLGT